MPVIVGEPGHPRILLHPGTGPACAAGGCHQRARNGIAPDKSALIHRWLPYLALFAGAVTWRAFFFQYQTYNHPILLLDQLKAAPLRSLVELSGTILLDLFETSLGAWVPALQRLASLNIRQVNGQATLALAAVLLVLTSAVILAYTPPNHAPAGSGSRRLRLQVVATGLAFLVTAGWPSGSPCWRCARSNSTPA